MMIGLPGAGKTTLAKFLADRTHKPIVSKDTIRFEVFRNEFDPENEPAVHEIYRRMLTTLLSRGYVPIIDATNTTEGERKKLYRLAETYGLKVTAVWVKTDPEEAWLRKHLISPMPREAFERIEHGFESPRPRENIDTLIIYDEMLNQIVQKHIEG